jgi:phosphomannomutase
VAFIRGTMAGGKFDALVTADGDADRPLIADETGRIVRGDITGMIASGYLGADVAVVLVTAGSAMERSGSFARVLRTKVGSPHVRAWDRPDAKAAASLSVSRLTEDFCWAQT